MQKGRSSEALAESLLRAPLLRATSSVLSYCTLAAIHSNIENKGLAMMGWSAHAVGFAASEKDLPV